MPTVSMFFGIVITMYPGDHPAPHFHARYAGYQAVYDFDGNRIQGDMPKRQDRFIYTWAQIHAEDLATNWSIAEAGGNPVRIDPLR